MNMLSQLRLAALLNKEPFRAVFAFAVDLLFFGFLFGKALSL